MSEARSAWAGGRFRRDGQPRLLFGRMYEDADIELAVLPPTGRVFAVASAGCTAFALAARGHDVTAVDVNPTQIDYARSRLGGGSFVPGSADRLLGRLRRLARLIGWSRSLLETFCSLDDVVEQQRVWSDRLDTRRFRLALMLGLRPLAIRSIFRSEFASVLPARFDRVLRLRLERGFAIHANQRNPYARQLLLGNLPPRTAHHAAVDLHCADAAAYLERVPPGRFDGFALSNILDGANVAYADRLFAAVRRAGSPEAKFVLRSLGEPSSPVESEWAERDRALIWGSIRVEEAA